MSPRLFIGLMLFVLALFSNIPFLISFRALRVAEVGMSWKILIAASLIVNASLLLFIPRYAREIGYWFWLLAFAALAWAFIGTTEGTPSVTKDRDERGIDPSGLEGVPFLVWAWLGFTLFWIGVTTSTYVHRDRRLSSDAVALATYVTDAAHLLDEAVHAQMLAALAAFEKETSTQIALAIYPKAPSGDIDEFTIRTAERSRLGTRAHDNGAILFLFLNERVARIEVGYGLEGSLPDAAVHRILSTKLAPSFARGDYRQGVSDTLVAVMDTVRSEYRGRAATGVVETAIERIRVAYRRVGVEGWTFLETAPIEGRLSISFFGSLFALVFRDGLVNAARLVYAVIRGMGNLLLRRPLRSGIPPLQYAPIVDSIKVLVFFIAILQGLVLIAGGGAFGGGGAAVRW